MFQLEVINLKELEVNNTAVALHFVEFASGVITGQDHIGYVFSWLFRLEADEDIHTLPFLEEEL